jgi:hypothetical protein
MGGLLFGLVAGSGLTSAFMSLRRDRYRHEYINRRCGGGEITLAQWEAMRTPFIEGPTQRGNNNGGPTTPKPLGYQPRSSRPGANPPPREP